LIVDNTKKGKSKHRSHFLAAGFSENDIDEFHADLARSVNTTIDSFLEDRPSRRKIAAFAIASALVPLESEDSLFPPTDWYPILFKELALRGDYGEPTVSAIITFNYDRSLEHYLTETAKRTYENDQRVRALNTLARLPIIHLHGQLGSYPQVPYVPNRSSDEIEQAAQSLSMIYDHHVGTSTEFERARQSLKEATDLLFLGFGYDKRSLERLGVLDNSFRCNIYGTSFGMSEEQRAELASIFRKRILLARGDRRIVHYLTDFHRLKLKDRARKAHAANSR
jgi:hypothetical protein